MCVCILLSFKGFSCEAVTHSWFVITNDWLLRLTKLNYIYPTY